MKEPNIAITIRGLDQRMLRDGTNFIAHKAAPAMAA
jgi:hypothetical protein